MSRTAVPNHDDGPLVAHAPQYDATPSEFGTFIAAETEKWAKVIRAANIRAE
jgi:hypothetical protein